MEVGEGPDSGQERELIHAFNEGGPTPDRDSAEHSTVSPWTELEASSNSWISGGRLVSGESYKATSPKK